MIITGYGSTATEYLTDAEKKIRDAAAAKAGAETRKVLTTVLWAGAAVAVLFLILRKK